MILTRRDWIKTCNRLSSSRDITKVHLVYAPNGVMKLCVCIWNERGIVGDFNRGKWFITKASQELIVVKVPLIIWFTEPCRQLMSLQRVGVGWLNSNILEKSPTMHLSMWHALHYFCSSTNDSSTLPWVLSPLVLLNWGFFACSILLWSSSTPLHNLHNRQISLSSKAWMSPSWLGWVFQDLVPHLLKLFCS